MGVILAMPAKSGEPVGANDLTGGEQAGSVPLQRERGGEPQHAFGQVEQALGPHQAPSEGGKDLSRVQALAIPGEIDVLQRTRMIEQKQGGPDGRAAGDQRSRRPVAPERQGHRRVGEPKQRAKLPAHAHAIDRRKAQSRRIAASPGCLIGRTKQSFAIQL
jgi:hypothetical protein